MRSKPEMITKYLQIVLPLFLLLQVLPDFNACAQEKLGWRQIKTVEDVYNTYPEIVRGMLGEINLDYPGLSAVKQSAESDDIVSACINLLEYYRNCDNAQHLRHAQPNQTLATVAEADTILNNVFTIQNVKGKVPFGPDGHRDWYYKGPNNDREWAWLSNRHSQLNFLLSTYLETGNPKYAEYIDAFLRDFIIKSMPYPAEKSGTSVWRGLEVAARAKVWSRIFYAMLDSPYLSNATRLLMLTSLPDHAHYNRNFHGGNNWLTMEISALATVATNFPEYEKSDEWLSYSVETMTESMKEQVYPDGVQTELTSHYHNVALRNFELFKNICDRANRDLPDFYNQTLRDMYSYIAHVVRPDGFRILNNDGDRGSDRDIILEGAATYNQPEWEYIVTNGERGIKPADGPSYFYPWAGHLISRSGFDVNAHWSFFDIGPWGSGHQHNDKLHISISAFGRDLLVDGGRFAYRGAVADKFRPYARSSKSHNVLLIDVNGQAPGIPVAKEDVPEHLHSITPELDYGSGTFTDYVDVKGSVSHSRSLIYVRGKYWVVVDRVATDRPRTVDVLWHWHPDCRVEEKKNRIVSSVNERGNLAVIPVGKQKWKMEFIEGQESPEIQGWYSEEYNEYEPNVASVYSTDIRSNTTFVWVLQPFEKERTPLKVKLLKDTAEGVEVRVAEQNGQSVEYFIPFQDSRKMNIKKN